MIVLQAGEALPVVRALFPRSGPVWRRAYTVLDGTAAGQILTDSATAPTWAAVQEHSDDGTLFLQGALSPELVGEVITALRRERIVVVCVRDDDALLPLLPDNPDYDGPSIDFDERDIAVELEPLCVALDGLRLARVDLELLPRLTWGPWAARSPESALEYGVGFCLLDEGSGQVVAEAYAGPITDGVLEMGTITDEHYRRRGLARVVCARTILECERQGHRTWWNATATNTGSLHLARSLGYRVELPHRALGWYQTGA